MPTFYLDLENGNDANDGLSFANRWRTFQNGPTAARIAPGDTIRVMATPLATDTGINATWVSGKRPNSANIASSTNASPISITTSAAHNLATGDTVVVGSHTVNTNANGVWEVTVTGPTTFTLNGSTGNGVGGATGTTRQSSNCRLILSSALNANIASHLNQGQGRVAWTASANVTTSLLADVTKAGNCSDQIAIAAGFTTGLAAYFPTGLLDLSGYQQVSFWIRCSSGTVPTAGQITLRLCSDTLGVTTVNTISVPAMSAALNNWHCFTVDLGANLGNAIQSVALYVATDVGAQTFQISNIIACKARSAADSLTLSSLVTKPSGEMHWAIQSIVGTRVMLDYSANTVPTSVTYYGYYGTSETVRLWKKEPFRVATIAAASTTVLNQSLDSGTTGVPITFSCGWDRTNMTTQVSDTWIDGVAGVGVGFSLAGFSNINLSNIGLVRVDTGVSIASSGNFCNNFLTNVKAAAITNTGFGLQSGCSGANGVEVAGSNSYGLFNAASIAFAEIANIRLVGGATILFVGFKTTFSGSFVVANGATNVQFNSCGCFVRDGMTIANAFSTNLSVIGSDNWFAGTTTLVAAQNNLLGGVGSGNFFERVVSSLASANGLVNGGGSYLIRKYESTSDTAGIGTSPVGTDGYVQIDDYTNNSVPQGSIAFGCGLNVIKDAAIVNTPGGESFRITIQGTPAAAMTIESRAGIVKLFRIRVVANQAVTVKAWMRRSSISLNAGLEILPGQIAGALTGVISYMTAPIDTWQEVTLSFTPTEAGYVTIHALLWGVAASAWIDDISFTQTGNNTIVSTLDLEDGGLPSIGYESVVGSGSSSPRIGLGRRIG